MANDTTNNLNILKVLANELHLRVDGVWGVCVCVGVGGGGSKHLTDSPKIDISNNAR